MKMEIKIPAMGESISEAKIGTFLKANGSFVKADEELLELETDKVNQVLYAPQAGTIAWNVSEGDTVKIGQVIGAVDDSGKEVQPEKSDKIKEAPKNKPDSKISSKEQPVEKSISSPVEKMASSQGSEEGARVTKEQALSDIQKQKPASSTPAPEIASQPAAALQQLGERSETRRKMSRVREVIASRLVDVLQQTAMLTTFNEVDMSKVIALRESYKEAFTKQYQTRLGFMGFFVKAAVSALKAFPQLNAYIDGNELVFRHYYDIGIAVGTDKGLFVPVVRNCDTLSFAELEKEIESFAVKAREGRLSPGDLQGGGFTITNGGTYGSLMSTPILNPPQSAILGMHKIMQRPVVIDNQIVARPMMYLALSYDHRVVDGKEAVSFLVHIKNVIEEPSRLLIGI